ncbi:SDR family NAD(P)-dependent oxidoreductase [Streptomyces diacarni]|uniref:SDR family NAD(P)-dependent oxidoreductase n=1 Tax=Streptomyces diacarni TaxID=2800381 RepID=A0A367F558_9ACTN|nr:SDR family oxidoreductase [Streptomyces diacarni]RCG24865.1 SDR family NAD(P)-dependent oxidoreductase [Streptomyces diacarni]
MTRRIAVSGAASGIGRSLAALLRTQGDDVVGIDLEDAEVCADLSTASGRSEAVEGVLERTGGALDAVVACAGISAVRPATVAVNFFGVTELLAGLRPALAASRAPRAAFVGSIAGTAATVPEVVDACLAKREAQALDAAAAAAARGEGNRIYPSSKAALARWMRGVCLTGDWAAAGIPLNAVAPGVVLTPMHAAHAMTEDQRKSVDEAVPMPLGGYAEPEVIARALRWLVSAENTHMTGQVMYVDGGAEATLRGPDRF